MPDVRLFVQLTQKFIDHGGDGLVVYLTDRVHCSAQILHLSGGQFPQDRRGGGLAEQEHQDSGTLGAVQLRQLGVFFIHGDQGVHFEISLSRSIICWNTAATRALSTSARWRSRVTFSS